MWRHVDGIRKFCDSFTAASFDNRTLGERVGVVIHELTENAIKYSRAGDSAELELSISHENDRIEVVVANSPAPEHVTALQSIFEKLCAAPAEEAYVAAMRRAATLPEGQSGLGLARIRHDCDVELSLSIENDLARITAKGKL
ncbi:MAG TPA: DUF6272 family protein [Polyangiaceae bacterium]|nr:DUF6272 family protein [Polyangiaceae bacterium]